MGGSNLLKIIIFFSFSLLLASCAVKPDFSAPDTHKPGTAWTFSEVENQLGGNDPIEPFNRAMFAVNDAAMDYVVMPLSYVYASILPEQAIKRIDMVSDNLAFPGKMISCFCQAKWGKGGIVFLRFLTNSTVGIAGFFDPANAWFGLRPRYENMGHAFASWGIGPGCLLILPGSVATNPRDQVGALFDSALDIKFILPYAQTVSMVNRIIYNYDSYKSMTESSLDGYETFKMSMLAIRYTQLHDFNDKQYVPAQKTEKSDSAPGFASLRRAKKYYDSEDNLNETLRVAYFSMQKNNRSWWLKHSLWNSDFITLGTRRSIRFSEELPKLRYRVWPESSRKTLAVILPGVGAHYTGKAANALAELLYYNGYAVAVMSSSMNWSFAEAAGIPAPGYVPQDVAKLREAIRLISEDIRKNTDLKDFDLVLAGLSLGGLHTLKIAELEQNKNTLNISRYLAINPPVDLMESMQKFDRFAAFSKAWNRELFFRNLDAALLRYIPLITFGGAFPVLKNPEQFRNVGQGEVLPPPFKEYRIGLSREQAGAMIGLSFHQTLRELILSAARRGMVPAGTSLKTPWSWWRRTATYEEIDRINGARYAKEFIYPRHPGKLPEELQFESSLYSCRTSLKNNPDVRIIHNSNDPILTPYEAAFLDRTFQKRIIWFDCGGHLGNLYLADFQRIILQQLEWKGDRK